MGPTDKVQHPLEEPLPDKVNPVQPLPQLEPNSSSFHISSPFVFKKIPVQKTSSRWRRCEQSQTPPQHPGVAPPVQSPSSRRRVRERSQTPPQHPKDTGVAQTGRAHVVSD